MTGPGDSHKSADTKTYEFLRPLTINNEVPSPKCHVACMRLCPAGSLSHTQSTYIVQSYMITLTPNTLRCLHSQLTHRKWFHSSSVTLIGPCGAWIRVTTSPHLTSASSSRSGYPASSWGEVTQEAQTWTYTHAGTDSGMRSTSLPQSTDQLWKLVNRPPSLKAEHVHV